MSKIEKEQKQEVTEKVDQSRRKLSKLGLVVAPTLLMVANRPAWGGGVCSPSILASGNLSAHPDQVNCKEGCSPGYWGHAWHADWGETGCGKTDFDYFSDKFGYPRTMDKDEGPFPEKSMFAVVSKDLSKDYCDTHKISNNLKQAGFHAVAAYLNAAHPAIATDYSVDEVITDFVNAHKYGDYSWFLGKYDDYASDTNPDGRVCLLGADEYSHDANAHNKESSGY